MHTDIKSETTFNYNSDMSGKVVVKSGDQEMEVLGEDLIGFVLDRLNEKSNSLFPKTGDLITGDLIENTMTFQMKTPVTLQAGEYVIIPVLKK